MRTFRLYVHPSGAYEIVPRGWSFRALVLGPLWAIGNGVFLRYVKMVVAPFLLLGVGMALLDTEVGGWAAVVAALMGVLWAHGTWVYFAARAFDWRAELLEKNGYEFVTGQSAWSGRLALKKWSSTEAPKRSS